MKKFCKRCESPAPHIIVVTDDKRMWQCDCCKLETPARKRYDTAKRRYIATLVKEFGINE